jgi:trehalose 6-phosphate phosphatase
VEGAREALAALVPRFRVVSIVTGRRSEEVRALLEVDGLRFLGLYGLEGLPGGTDGGLLRRAEGAAAVVPNAWVEDKGVSIAIHYRQAPDPLAARAALLEALREVAASAGRDLVEGKMVIELLPPDRPLKGGAVERLVQEQELEAVLFAGDDVADLDAFEALGRLEDEGVLAIRVAVRGEESPDELLAAADLVVDGPRGLVELLRRLA